VSVVIGQSVWEAASPSNSTTVRADGAFRQSLRYREEADEELANAK